MNKINKKMVIYSFNKSKGGLTCDFCVCNSSEQHVYHITVGGVTANFCEKCFKKVKGGD